MPEWDPIFVLSVPLAELLVRGSATFVVVLVLLRIVGQRESGSLGITDVLLIVLIAEASGPGLRGAAQSVGDSIVIVITILFWSVLIDAVSYRFPRAGQVLKARPRLLIKDGQLNRALMRREFMTMDEVESILRTQGIDDIAEVARARLEPNGQVSVLRRDSGTASSETPPVRRASE